MSRRRKEIDVDARDEEQAFHADGTRGVHG